MDDLQDDEDQECQDDLDDEDALIIVQIAVIGGGAEWVGKHHFLNYYQIKINDIRLIKKRKSNLSKFKG